MALFIKTTQNVLLEYEPASVGERIGATLVDYLIFLAWFILTVAVPSGLKLIRFNSDSIVYILVVVALPVFIYDFLCEWLLNGQSVGKIALKIRVVMLDGSPPGVGAYLMRWLLRLVDTRLFSGFVAVVCVAATGKGQRLGDMAAGTTVIRLQPNVTLDDVVYTNLPPNYRVRFDEARQLSDKDVNVIRAVMRQGNDTVIEQAANRVKMVLGVSSPQGNYEFLNTIINDYQFLSMQE